jgi:hypothetical protein
MIYNTKRLMAYFIIIHNQSSVILRYFIYKYNKMPTINENDLVKVEDMNVRHFNAIGRL